MDLFRQMVKEGRLVPPNNMTPLHSAGSLARTMANGQIGALSGIPIFVDPNMPPDTVSIYDRNAVATLQDAPTADEVMAAVKSLTLQTGTSPERIVSRDTRWIDDFLGKRKPVTAHDDGRPPEESLLARVEEVAEEMGAAISWDRVVNDDGEVVWECTVKLLRGEWKVRRQQKVPTIEWETWPEALRRGGVL